MIKVVIKTIISGIKTGRVGIAIFYRNLSADLSIHFLSFYILTGKELYKKTVRRGQTNWEEVLCLA